MKLHLPVGLRAALLAVLLCSPMAMGNVKVYQGVKEDGSGGTEVIPMDGEIDSYESGDGWSFFGDVVITVDGETTGGDGLTDLTYSGNTDNCRTTITVESGGTFTCQGGSTMGTVSAFEVPSPLKSETIFNVSGGTVDLNGIRVGCFSDDPENSSSSVIFNISENGRVLSASSQQIGLIDSGSSNHSEVTLNLTSGGTLKVGSATFGCTFGGVQKTDSSSVVTVSVDGENSSVELSAPSIGNVSAANSTSVVDIDVTQHGSFILSGAENSDVKNPSGSIGTVSSADSRSDVYITVAGEGSLFEIASYWQTIGTVSTSKGGVQHLGSSKTTIEVKEGGVFTHKMGDVGLNKSTAAIPEGGSAATTELMLTVDGGTYNMGFCNDKQGSHLGGVGTPATDIHGKNTTEIYVQNKGQFNFKAKRGYIGASYNDGSDVTLNIFLDKGGVFSFERYEDDDTKSQVETHIGYACGGNVNLTLDVGADSQFNVLPQSKAQQIDQSIGAAQAYLNTTSEVSAKVDIYLHDGGTMDFRPTTITSFSGVHFAGIGISYGKSDKKVSAATSITVGNKDQQTETEGMSEGAASTFNFGGGDIGLAWVSGDGKVENTAAITVNEGGTFTMTGGRLGYVNVSSNGKGTVKQDLSLTLNGGDMMITGGSILASEGGRTAGTSERTGSIELSGDSVLTIGKDVTIGDVEFDITMHGGTLAGDGISKLKGDVSIDTGEGFTGTIGLGGIEAGRIKQVRINSGDIAIVDIGAGTLTLDAEDILTVGEQSAWDGEGASTAPKGKQALLQFKTEGSSSPSEGCTVDVNGKIALNFDGQYLAEQKGKDGTVTLRVWITNGKLAVAEEGSKAWAEEHFEIGTGWGLEVTSYDAAQGMLILEGTSTVWVATVDGDDGNSHAAADASDLGKYTKVIVDEGTTFTADGNATIRQLEGQNGSQLDLVKGEKIESATITLENVNKEGSLGTGDTAFDGSITAGDGVNLRKTGDATLTVQGTLQAEGDVSIEVGELVLESDNNTVAGVLSMEAKGKLQVKQALTLSGTSHLTAGTITGSGTLTVAEGGELSIEADSGWTLGVSNIHVAGTLSQKKSPIAAENIVVQAGGKWTQESDAYYNPSDKKWVDQLTRTEVGQSIGVENTGTVEQKGTSVSADTITVAGTWTQDKVTLTDESVAQTWNKNHDVHAETRANSIVVQAGGNYNLMDGAISALGGDGDEPGTLDLQVSGTFTMSDGDVAKGGNASITVEHGGVFNMNGSGNIACVGGERDPRAEISIQGGDFTLSGDSSIGNVGTYPWDLKSPCTSTVIIEITEDGGNFTLSGNGQIGIASGYGDTSDITINVKGGKFLVQNDNSTQSSLGEVQQASDADCTNKVEIGINVTGNGQFVLAEGGIGCADFASSANGQCSASTDITVADSGVFKMEGGNLGCKLSDSASLSTALHIELSDQGQMQISGGKVGEGATLDLSDDAVLTQTGGEIAKGTFTLSDGAKLTQSKGTINGGSITLNGSASLTQSGAGTISGSSITLSGSATIEQDGGQITGGSLDLSGSATLTQSSGTIDGASITLSGATMKQTGGEITGGTLDLSGGATLTQSKGTINGGSITLNGSANLTQSDGTIKDSSISLKGGATMKQDGGQITGGSLDLSGSATLTQSSGTIDGASITLSGAAMKQTGGEITGGTLDLSGGATLTQSKGTINGGSITLNGSANLTQSDGTIKDSSISLKGGATMTQSNAGTINGTSVTLSGEGTSFVQEGGSIGEGAKFSLSDSATMEQTGGKITGGTLELSGGATMTQSNAGTINGTSVTLSGEGTSFAQEGGSIGEGATFSLSDNATMEQTGGEITGGTLELNDGASLTQSKGTISGASITLSGATMEQKGGEVTDGTLELSGGATLTQTGGQITGGTLELSGGATLTQSDGTINVASITLSGATMEQTGGEITGGTLQLSGGATLTQSDGTINVDSITLSGATMEQTGGEITGGTLQLSGGASLTQSGAGTISGSSITLSGGATMEQTGGEITGGTLQLSGGATMTSAGTINGTSVTLSGEGTSFAQEGGNIDERATFSLGAGAKLTLSGGNMNGAVTMEGEASSYDLGNRAAKGSITMQGGSLANAGNYAGSLAIQTDATYTDSLDLGGVDAARITQVKIGASGTELHNLKSGSTLTFGEGDNKMVVGEQHVYREGQIEPVGGTMVQFQDGNGQIAFGETGKLQLHLESEVLKGLEGQLEILFTNGSFSGMPEGGQKELEEWLSRHFELEKGMEDIKVLLLHDAEGGRLILTGSTQGIWIASRNGQNVDVADLLNDYSAVIADENLTLTLPTTQEEPTIVNQLQNDSGKYGDFIVTTELGATAGHTVQLHNEDANGDTKFYGNIRVERTGLEAAALEKTGDAALNVHGNLESSGTVQVKEGTLALLGKANSIGTLAMSGGKLQVNGTLELTGTTEMSEGSSGSISGTGNVKLGSGASLTLAGGVSYEVQNTQLDNGARMSQRGEVTIKGGVITLSGEDTSYTQAGGTISGATFSLGDGANLTQSKGTIDGVSITLSGGASMRQDGGQITGGTLGLSGGATMTSNGTINGTSVALSGEGTSYTQAGESIGEGATFSLSDGATLTLRGGSMNGAVTMEGKTSRYDLGNQAAKGSITMHGGSLANAGNYEGSLAIQTEDTYTGALDLGGVDAARITQVQIGASGTELRNLKSGSTLTFGAGDEMVVGEQHVVYRGGQTEPAGGTLVQFQEGKGQIAFDENSALRLHLKSEVLKGLEGQLEILFTNGSFSGMPEGGQKELEAWLGEHFVLDAGLEDIKVLLLNDAEGGRLILTGSSSGIWIASRNGQNVDVADLLNHYSVVIVDKDLTLTLPTTQEETLTIVNQLRNDEKTHGDFIVKTESGATAGHTVQLHNANTNGDNGGTEFYGNIRVEGTGLEAATLEKTGDAALNVHGNLESSGTVQVKEGTLALSGEANSVGTLAMSGGKLQVDGTLALIGRTEMSEGSSGSISGKGNVKLGSGASLTLAGGVSYEVQNTQLENGAQMSQKGETAIKGGSIKLSGEGTSYTQVGGTISGEKFSLGDGANLTQSKGTIDGASITLSGSASMRQDGGQITGGTLDLSDGAKVTQSAGTVKDSSITLSGGATMTQSDAGTISGASITLSGEGTSYTQAGGSIGEGAKFSLGEGATLTLSGGSMNGAVTMEGKTSHYDLGNQAAQGSIAMHGGSLANAGNYGGNLAIQTSDTYTGALDLGGVDAARITSIQLAGKDTYLTGLKEGSTLTLHTDNSFKVTEQNVWVDGKGGPEGKQAFFQFGTAGAGEVGTVGVVDVASGAIITLNFVGQQIAEAVGEDGGITLKVWITNGQLGGGKTEDAAGTWAGEHFVIGTGWGLNVESYDADQGMLVLKGQSNIWDARVNGDQVAGHAEASASELDLAEKVIIDENTVVAVDQDATIHQLDGEGAYSLELENKGEGDKTITLRNHGSSDSAMGSTGDTVFGGDILAGNGVNLRKTGDAALEVQGSLKAEGNVAVEEGKLVLGENGEHSIGGELSLGEHGTLQVDGSLTLSGSMSNESAGTFTGQGTVILDGENVTFGDVTLGEELTFQMGDNCGSVDFGERDVTLSNLKGNSVKGREITLTGGEGGVYSGTVDGRLVVENNVELLGRDNEACDLVIQGTTGQATLAADSKYNSLDNGGDGGTGSTLKIASGDSSAGAQITVNGNIVFRKGAETDFTINLSDPGLWTANEEEHDATMLSTEETIYIEHGTKFVIDCSQKGISDAKGDLTHVVILKGKSIQEVEKYDAPEKNSGANRQAVYAASVGAAYAMQTRAAEEQPEEQQVRRAQVEGGVLFNQLYETPTMWTNGTESWIDAKHRTMSPLANLATTSNSMSGLRLLWQDLNDKGLTQATQQVSEILALLDNLAATNPAAARQMMAAVAGSTLTSLSSAQNAALRNQMSRVRDHALQAARLREGDRWGNGQGSAVTDAKGTTQRMLSSGSTTHAWIEGTSFFSEQHSVGDESGYRLNSWGGAVGVDKQLNNKWSVGAYLSASYGDLEARAAEYAKGDMDTYAVGVWGQNHTGRWGNTLLALWAWNDASLRRMVNNGAGYAGRSDAGGYSIGAQWELTYDLCMNERKTNVLQPLFSVAVMRTEMDGFSEKGAGSLGLNVKDQTRDTVTLALGARWLAAISSGKAINRAVNTELHANVAQDLGDRRSDADVALQVNPIYIRNVRGAKAGSTAFQFGAGVNVPMTPNSQIYVNAGGELREHASSWNAALGVRMGF